MIIIIIISIVIDPDRMYEHQSDFLLKITF